MGEGSSKPSPAGAGADLAGEESFWSEMKAMVSLFWASRERNRLLALTVGIVVVVDATAYAQISLTPGTGPSTMR